MANVLVVIELAQGKPLPVSLEVLGQARRVSTLLGASLYAVVPLDHAPSHSENDLIADLAGRGADKVVLVIDVQLKGARNGLRWGTHGAALSMACDLLPPSLLLYGLTPGAREVAPRAAARLGAAFLAEAWVEVRNDVLHLWEGSGQEARSLEGDLEFPVVATVPPGRYELARGEDEAEVEVLTSTAKSPDFRELEGDEAKLEEALHALVIAPAELRGSVEELARAVDGQVAEPGLRRAVRLAVAVGTPLDGVQADVRVAVGPAAATDGSAHYALVGVPGDAANGLALALATASEPADAPPAAKPAAKEEKP